MRIETIERKLLTYDELSDAAKDKARDWYRQASQGDEFYAEAVIEDAKEIGKRLGIAIDKVYYSGFWSQGDGACFEGSYSFKKNSVKDFLAYAPCDDELKRIANELAALQKANRYSLCASVKHRGHYYHEGCTEISVSRADDKETSNETDETLTELLRDFMRWIYRSLEREYEYQNSDEQVTESIQANEYEFLENGERA